MIARLVVAAIAAAASAKSGKAPPPAADTVVITGAPRSPQALRAEAVAFVHASGVVAEGVQAVRWTEPACPRVIGLTDKAMRAVDAKLRLIAADAGIAVAVAPCRANIAVVFALDGGAVVRRIVARTVDRATLDRLSASQDSPAVIDPVPITDLRTIGMTPFWVKLMQ